MVASRHSGLIVATATGHVCETFPNPDAYSQVKSGDNFLFAKTRSE